MPPSRIPPVMSLRAFEAVARHESFKKAGKELSVTPGALSQQVKNLESYLDKVLILRDSRSMKLSEAGKLLKIGLTEGFGVIRKTIEQLENAQFDEQLSVCCSSSFASKWLAQRLPSFLEHHENFDIAICSEVEEKQTAQHDVHITFGKLSDASNDSEKLGQESLVAVASPEFIAKHAIETPVDLTKVPLLMENSLARLQSGPAWKDWFLAAGIEAPQFHRSINFGAQAEQAIDVAIGSGGALFTRQTLVNHDLKCGKLKCLFDIRIETPLYYYLKIPTKSQREYRVNLFADWLKTHFYAQQLTYC